jgi:hypothetical protein
MEQHMRKSYLGLLFVFALLAAVATTVQSYRFDRAASALRASAAAFDREAGSTAVSIAEFRAAEMAYLAAGQGPDFWMHRASDLAGAVTSAIARMQNAADSEEAGTHLQAAAAAFADLQTADKRARTTIQNDQPLVASDIIFSDALEPADRLTTELDAARAAVDSAAALQLAQFDRWGLLMNGGVLGLLVVLLLVAGRSAPRVEAPSEAATMAQMLRSLPPPVRNTSPAASRTGAAASTSSSAPIMPNAATEAAAPAVATPPPAVAPPAVVNLPEAAELCVDLARVIDGHDIPALLERAAGVLDATGVIVWVADTRGNLLTPSLAHGYPERVLARLGVLETGADNVTSLSFRSMKPQVMGGGGSSRAAAIAVPLISTSGCVGVLSAEVREPKPPADRIAVARIIAAQLATLVAPQEPATAAAQA